ncbi:Virulence-regulating protein VirS [Variovorax sp. PBS-H4]|uniref:AraC family transcriptional regulator n=1 Tax=Variovorax sp. PBS-H4 TaxID=434008 RepID=UPI001316C6DB|nr:AraC family transcriptional regulator [Variovorax sp. PBS-H4]VTU27921.1 Virulence-regulating protein VirS [Variovorax sp. PBS-H4]
MDMRTARAIRSATLLGYPQAARAVGLDPARMFERVGLDLRCMEDHETQISFDAFLQLLAESARQADCPDFASRAAIARGTPNYGTVSLLMREAETLEEALNFYTSHLTLHADGTFIELDKRFQNPLVFVEISARTQEESFQCTQYALVGITMQIRWLIGDNFQPDLVSFGFPRPARADAIQRFFKCPVLYKQVVSGLVLDRRDLERQLVTSPPFLRKLARDQLASSLPRSPGSFSMKVGRVIQRMIGEGTCEASAVAEHFRVDRRTLNRRLEHEGETYSSVLQRVRVDIACRALHGSDCSMTQVADAAGFKNLSSFSRWFQKSFECTASDWRSQAARGGNGASPPV